MRLSVAFLTVAAAVLAEARRCAAQVKPNNLVSTSTSGALSALKYTNVGGSGSYNEVTDIIPGTFPTCDANPFCVTKPKQITGEYHPLVRNPWVRCTNWRSALISYFYPPLQGTSRRLTTR